MYVVKVMINGLVLSASVTDTLREVVKILWSISPAYAVLCVLVCIIWIFATILGIMGMKEAEKKPFNYSDEEAAACS